MSSHTPSSLEATLASLNQIVTDTVALRRTAEQVKGQLETVVKQERERLNPTPLQLAARNHGYSINLITSARNASEGSLVVAAGDVVLLHNRLWITDQYGETRVLEATGDQRCWNAIPAKLPKLDYVERPAETIAGAEVRTVLQVRCEVDGGGLSYLQKVDVNPTSRTVVPSAGRLPRYSAAGS